MAEEQFAEHGEKLPPWGKRTRSEPIRTYTGRVVYDKPKRRWTVADLERVIASIDFGGTVDNDSLFLRLVYKMRDATLRMLGEMVPLLESQEIEVIYDWIQSMLIKVFGLKRDMNLMPTGKATDMIYLIAAHAGLDVTVKLKK